MNGITLMSVFLGGGVGSLCRYGLSVWLGNGNGFPWGTFSANVISCIFLGLFLTQFNSYIASSSFWYPFLVIGFC
ncbi:MAG: CrcB family protein, partial [Flavobacteriales bacterium]|nr:CrcB family protein [Flavobacteriales bacterium]